MSAPIRLSAVEVDWIKLYRSRVGCSLVQARDALRAGVSMPEEGAKPQPPPDYRSLAEGLAGALRSVLGHAASGVERLANVLGPDMVKKESESIESARSALAAYDSAVRGSGSEG